MMTMMVRVKMTTEKMMIAMREKNQRQQEGKRHGILWRWWGKISKISKEWRRSV